MKKIGNEYLFYDDYVIIKVFNKKHELLGQIYIDKEDYHRVSNHTWYISSRNYAFMTYKNEGENRRWIQLHRFIINPPDNMDVDHQDRNRLNCRKSNLRIVTNAQNRQNLSISGQKTCRGRRSKSKYRGVSFHEKKKGKKWRAQCQIDGKKYHIGWYSTEIEAAISAKKFRDKYMPYSKK